MRIFIVLEETMKVHKTTTLGVFFSVISFVFIVSEEYGENTLVIYHYLQYLIAGGIITASVLSIKQPRFSSVITGTIFILHFMLILQYLSVLSFVLTTFCILLASVFYFITPKNTYQY